MNQHHSDTDTLKSALYVMAGDIESGIELNEGNVFVMTACLREAAQRLEELQHRIIELENPDPAP